MMQTAPFNYRWVMVGILWLAHVIAFFNTSSLGILAPFIQEEFKVTSAKFGFLIAAAALGSALMQIPVGLITDYFGIRLILSIGVVLIGFLLSLFSSAYSFETALLIISLYGLASGVINPTCSKSILDWFPTVGRATGMGLKQTGVNLGGILAGILLPLMVLHFSWRRSLLLVGLTEIASALFIYRFTRESPIQNVNPPPAFEWKKLWGIIFHRDVLVLGGICFCLMAVQFCFSAYLTLFLTRELKYSVVQAGYYFALAYLVGAVARILWSLASDYLFGGRRKGTLLVITGVTFFSLLSLCLISFLPSLSVLLLPSVLAFGAGGIGWNAIYLTILGEAMDKEYSGLVTGAGYFYGFLGNLVSAPFFGFIVDQTGAYGFAWMYLVLLTVAIFFLLGRFQEKAAR